MIDTHTHTDTQQLTTADPALVAAFDSPHPPAAVCCQSDSYLGNMCGVNHSLENSNNTCMWQKTIHNTDKHFQTPVEYSNEENQNSQKSDISTEIYFF